MAWYIEQDWAVCRSNHVLDYFDNYDAAKEFMLKQTLTGFYYLYYKREWRESHIVDTYSKR